MREQNVVTLPIIKEENLEGLITINDIAMSYMEVYDSHILADAKTPYENILETLEGKMLVGDKTASFTKGWRIILKSTIWLS